MGPMPELRRHLVDVVPVDVFEWRSSTTIPHREPVAGTEIRLISESDEGAEVLPKRFSKVTKAYLARGDRGYLATVDGSFAGWLWLSRVSHRDPFSGLRLRIAADEAYAYAMWAEPRHRQLGVGPMLMAALLQDVEGDPALERVYGWVDSENREMQVMMRVMFGFKAVQQVRRARFLHLLGWQVPGSDEPKYGPVSRAGRHSNGAVRSTE
jgi:GNAT superfamily N-acetyltransferase